MSENKPIVIFHDEMRTPLSSEFTDIQYLARGGQQPNPRAWQVPDIDGIVRMGRKYGIAALSAGEPSDQDYTCPACGSDDNPDHFSGRCPACGHEAE